MKNWLFAIMSMFLFFLVMPVNTTELIGNSDSYLSFEVDVDVGELQPLVINVVNNEFLPDIIYYNPNSDVGLVNQTNDYNNEYSEIYLINRPYMPENSFNRGVFVLNVGKLNSLNRDNSNNYINNFAFLV